MEPDKTPKKSRFKIEKLEDRLAPSHLNPGVGSVVLPEAAAHGEQGIAVSNAATQNHSRPIIIIAD